MSRLAIARRLAWHPVTIAGCLGALAIWGSLLPEPAGPVLAWPALGLTAGYATSGSV